MAASFRGVGHHYALPLDYCLILASERTLSTMCPLPLLTSQPNCWLLVIIRSIRQLPGKAIASMSRVVRSQANVRVFISYAHDNATHEHRVRAFCDALRLRGIDARLDLPAAAQRQDWPLWMLREFMAANFVLMIASPEYKRRAEGRAPPGKVLAYSGKLL